MSTINIKVKQVVKYGGHSLSSNGSVNFTLKAQYSELQNTIKLMQILNDDITVKAKIPGKKPTKIGLFRIKQLVIDGDGESSIKLNGLNDYIEMDKLNELPLNSDENKEFVVLYDAQVEMEDEEENESEEEQEW